MMLVHWLRLAVIFPALVLSGCMGSDDRPVEVAVIGASAAPFVTKAPLPPSAQLLRAATHEGLVAFDEQGLVVPALADRWIVTDDGLSYIFRLRDGSWADGTPITGETARAALTRAMAAQRGTPLGLDLSVVAEVRAMAGRVIEIRLASRQPEFLQVLAQPDLGLARAGKGAGPMRLRREEDSAFLRPIPPEDRGMPQHERWHQRARNLELNALPAKTAIERFNRGELDVVLGGTFNDFPRLDAMGVARAAVRLDPVAGLFGLVVVRSDGFLAEAQNREAISMAIDRQALAAAVNLSGWITTTRVINPGLSGDDGTIGERWTARTLDERRSIAAARVAAWEAGGRKAVVLRVALPAGPGSDLLFRRLRQDLAAIGADARRVADQADADLRLIDAIASYGSAQWFFSQLSCAVQASACNPSADKFAAQARQEDDPAKQAGLVSQAEAQLTLSNGYIPIGVPIRWSLVGGTVTGFAVNRLSVHPLMSLAMLPR